VCRHLIKQSLLIMYDAVLYGDDVTVAKFQSDQVKVNFHFIIF